MEKLIATEASSINGNNNINYININSEGESATVWSLGILLYSLVVRNTPFQDSKQILEATYKIPQHLYLSNGFHAFLNWCLQVRPQDRPTLDQMANHPWLKPLK